MRLKKIDPEIAKLLYQLLYDVHCLFQKEGIMYWVDGGTCLGAVRHSGIIPWDDDVDIAVFKSERRQIQDLEPVLNKLGYGLLKVYFGFKIFYLNRKPSKPNYKYSYPNLDIFFYNFPKTKATRVEYTAKRARDEWPGGYFTISELLPLKSYKFGSFHVWGINNPKSYFSRLYGSSWNKVAYREYDHETEEMTEKVKMKLTSKDRVPAKPTKVKKRVNCC